VSKLRSNTHFNINLCINTSAFKHTLHVCFGTSLHRLEDVLSGVNMYKSVYLLMFLILFKIHSIDVKTAVRPMFNKILP